VNPRNTLLLFLVAAGLGALAYFYEIEGATARKSAEDEAKRLFPGIESSAIDSLEFTTSDGKAVRVERRAGAWKLTQPLEFPADEFAVDGIASALADVKSESKLEKPQPPEVYGLADASRDARFAVGDKNFSLRIGKAAPVGSKSYASTGASGDVHTIATFAANALQRKLDDLRDKRVARFDPEAVQRIVLRWAGEGVVLARADSKSEWRLEEPLRGEADPGAVDDLLSDLRFLRSEGFVDEAPSDQQAGLATPDLTIEISGGAAGDAAESGPAASKTIDGETLPLANAPFSLQVAFGAKQSDDYRLVRGAEHSLYKVPAGRIDDFPRSVNAYRFRTLSDFDSLDATRVELRFQPRAENRSVDAVEIEATRGEATWTSEPEAMDPGKLDAMLRALAKLSAREILADSAGPEELANLGLEPPLARIRVFGTKRAPGGEEEKGGEESSFAEVLLGHPRPGGGIVAKRADRDTIFELEPALASQIPIDLENYRKSFLAPPPAPPAAAEAKPDAAPPAAEVPEAALPTPDAAVPEMPAEP
jgi:hypothetical protein